MKILISIEFTHNKDGWSWDSGIKNKAMDYFPERETIHDLVKRACEFRGMELTHKGKPLATLYNEDDKPNGYAYRGKSWGECRELGMKPRIVYWSIWVHIAQIIPFNFEKDSVRNVPMKSLKAA